MTLLRCALRPSNLSSGFWQHLAHAQACISQRTRITAVFICDTQCDGLSFRAPVATLQHTYLAMAWTFQSY